MKRRDLGQEALLSTFLAYVETLVKLFVGVVSIAVIIRAFGSEAYGVFVFTASAANYLALSELGLGSANSRDIGRAFFLKDSQTLHASVATSLVAFVAISLFIVVLSWFLSPLVASVGHIPEKHYSGAVTLGWLAGCSIAFSVLSGWANGVLGGLTRLIRIQVIRIIERIAYLVGVLWAVSLGSDIENLGWALVASSAFAFLLRGMSVFRYVSLVNILRPQFLSRAQFRSLASFGGAVSVIKLDELVLKQSDHLLIGVILGPQAVAIYSVTLRLYQYIDKVLRVLTKAVFPVFLRYHTLGKLAEAQKWYCLLIITTTTMGIVGASAYALLGQDGIRLWTDGQIIPSSSLILIFSFMLVSRSGLEIGSSTLLAFGHHWPLARQLALQTIINLACTVFLLKSVGTVGAAIATVLAEALTVSWFVPVTVAKTLCLSTRRAIEIQILRPLLAGWPAVIAIWALTALLEKDGLISFVTIVMTGTILGIIGVVCIGYTGEQRDIVEAQLKFLIQGRLNWNFIIRMIPRLLTNWIRLLPHFLIIGAQRCGTTSLYEYLTRHPNVASALAKEVDFFDYNFTKGLWWYRSHFPSFFKKLYIEKIRREDFITGEASVDYLFYPHSYIRIQKMIPKVKLIVLLRNPVDRAYSQYCYNVKRARENLSFEDAIDRELRELKDEGKKVSADENYYSFDYRNYLYLSRGIYIDQLKVYMNRFPKEQILILKSEDFYADPASILDQIYSFLNLSVWKLKEFTNYNFTDYHAEMNSDTRRRLIRYFEPYNQELYKYLNVDFDWER